MRIGTALSTDSENVILDLDHLESLTKEKKKLPEFITELIKLDDWVVEEPQKIPFTAEEAIWLDHALFLQPYKTNSKEVKALTRKIFQEIKANHKHRINEPEKTQEMLEKVIINLWRGYFCDQPIMYYRNKNAYTQPKRYQENHFTYTRIITVTDNLKELGYIEMEKGFYPHDDEDKPSKVTRMWAAPKLMENFLSYEDVVLPDFYEPTLPKETIILKEDDEDRTNKSKKSKKKKKKKKKNVDYKDNNKTRAMRDNLSIYNQYNDKQDFDIVLDGETEVTNNFITECLHKNITSRMMRIRKVLIREEVEELKIGLKSKEYVHEAGIFKKVKSLYEIPKSYIQRKNSESIHQDNVIKYDFLKHIEEMTDYNKKSASTAIPDYDSNDTFKTTYKITSEISEVTNSGLAVALPDYESNNKNQICETDPICSDKESYGLAVAMIDYNLGNQTTNRLSKLPPVSSKRTDTGLSIDIPRYDPEFNTDGKTYIPNQKVKSHIYDFTHISNHIGNDTAMDTTPDLLLEDGVTNTKTCNVLKTNGFHSEVVSEKLLMELLVTASRFSCFLKNLDTQNRKKRAAITKKNKKLPKEERITFEGLSITNNKTFLDQKCKLKDIGIEYLEIELTYNHARRVFSRGNKRFKYNGRFYGQVHQSIPKKHRKNIRINGEPVVEPDFSAMHPRMLYHQADIDKRGDIYNIKGYPDLRDTFKSALLIAINAKNKKVAVSALGKRVNEKNLPKPEKDLDGNKIKTPMKWCISKILEAHEPIAEFICADKGVELMREDSGIMENILMALMAEDIPGLSVHDSVIVPQRHEERLRQIMMEEYKKVMDFYPIID